jgi:hypothetical protein
VIFHEARTHDPPVEDRQTLIVEARTDGARQAQPVLRQGSIHAPFNAGGRAMV